MTIVLIILAVIAWLFLEAARADAGVGYRSRRSLRYQRRKANRLGLDPSEVHVRSRTPGFEYPAPIGRSHVADLAFGLAQLLAILVLSFLGLVAIGAFELPIGLFWVWLVGILLGTKAIGRLRINGWRFERATGEPMRPPHIDMDASADH